MGLRSDGSKPEYRLVAILQPIELLRNVAAAGYEWDRSDQPRPGQRVCSTRAGEVRRFVATSQREADR